MLTYRPGRLLTVFILSTIGLTAGAGIASAHVSVNPGTAIAGSYPKLTFRVPNESAKASTVRVRVDFPTDHPFASVSVKKEPGWTAQVRMAKLTTPVSDDDNATITQAVSSITWIADASGKIALGQFAEFDVAVGPVPKVPSIAFTAIQTYDDGSVVKWDQPTPARGAAPEYPAPVLTITAAATSPSATAAAAINTTATVSVAPVAATSDSTARTLGVVGIIVGAIGLLVAAVALRSRPGAGS